MRSQNIRRKTIQSRNEILATDWICMIHSRGQNLKKKTNQNKK